LKAFQLLSAHVKLLLDAPEHLWRLIENKEYLLATWLYLLCRVVHRALLIDDPEEAIWKGEGIDIPVSTVTKGLFIMVIIFVDAFSGRPTAVGHYNTTSSTNYPSRDFASSSDHHKFRGKLHFSD
jgi:hypothetical protein